MKKLAVLSLLCSCASHPPDPFSPVDVAIRPGEVVHFQLNLSQQEGGLFCKDRAVPVFFAKGYQVFLAESYFSPLAPYQCSWRGQKKDFVVANVTVNPKPFPSERLRVDKKRVSLAPQDWERVKREKQLKKAAYDSGSKRLLFKESFDPPIRSRVTSVYGSRRVFNNKKQTQHLGTDYRAGVGTPIKASNKGRIALARDLFFTGKTVFIDHGMGIFTVYGHLSKIFVQTGGSVSKGEVIALSGQTGRVTGPHLHWGVVVNGLAVEGPSLVLATRKYFQNN